MNVKIKKFVKKTVDVGIAFLFGVGFVFFAYVNLVGIFKGPVALYGLYNDMVQPTDWVSEVGCSSNSMGLTMRCGDTLFMNKVQSDEKLYIGRVYVYEKINKTIVHRLVACIDVDCNLTLFKGDNNPVAEFVNKSNITYQVVKVAYG